MSLTWSPDYAPVDGDFADVSLLLKGEGTNGSTTILDSSSNNLSVTAVDNAQISTAVNTPFGTGDGVLAFDGSGDYLNISYDSGLDLSSGDFTIEFFTYVNSYDTSGVFFLKHTGAGTGGYEFWASTDGTIRFNANGSTVLVFTGSGVFNLNQWNHIAVCLDSSANEYKLFYNGIFVGSRITSFRPSFTSAFIAAGSYITSSNYDLNGYLSNLRITKGVARYTENFDVPTAPFPILSPSGRITIADDSLDADARQYIINVEEQDGEELEAGVRTAINNFVVGCKSDGIWNAIKASCLLCGARTLEGALVPLKGGAPTNFNFTLSDYDRELGLLGNGSTKYLDANRKDNADPQDNSHRSVYVSTAGNLTFNSYIGNLAQFPNRFSCILAANDNFLPGGRLILLERSSDGSQQVGGSTQTGFIGTSRSTSSQSSGRATGTTTLFDVTNSPANTLRNLVFARDFNGAVNLPTNGRIAFYSIGEALDLALLDTRISAFITAIGAAI